jgi:hypothetical protein
MNDLLDIDAFEKTLSNLVVLTLVAAEMIRVGGDGVNCRP